VARIYLAHSWFRWINELAQHFEYTLDAYLSMNVHVHIIQQPPMHGEELGSIQQVYKRLLDENNLSDARLREVSLTRAKYVEQQSQVEIFFSKFKNRRGVNFIYIEDLVCDEKYCPIGTGELPYFSDLTHISPVMAHILKARIFSY
jgi:hypothetical protein